MGAGGPGGNLGLGAFGQFCGFLRGALKKNVRLTADTTGGTGKYDPPEARVRRTGTQVMINRK